MSPSELAPTTQEQLQWPMWGQYYEHNRQGRRGARRCREVQELVAALRANGAARDDDDEREQIWLRDARDQRRRRCTRSASSPRALQPVVVRDNAAQRARRRRLQLGSRAPTSACTTPTRSGSTPRERR